MEVTSAGFRDRSIRRTTGTGDCAVSADTAPALQQPWQHLRGVAGAELPAQKLPVRASRGGYTDGQDALVHPAGRCNRQYFGLLVETLLAEVLRVAGSSVS